MANGTTENQSAEVKTVSYEQMLELGHGLIIAKVPLTSLREQDINSFVVAWLVIQIGGGSYGVLHTA